MLTVMTTILVPLLCVTAPIHVSPPTIRVAAKTETHVQMQMSVDDEPVSHDLQYDALSARASVVGLSSRCVSPIQHPHVKPIPALPHVSMAVPSLALPPTVIHVQIRIPMVSVMT